MLFSEHYFVINKNFYTGTIDKLKWYLYNKIIRYLYKIKGGYTMNDMYITIYEKLSTLQWLMRRHQMICQSELGAFADTSRGQGRILAMLKIQPEITTKDLSYLLGIRQQSLNELLNKLEKNGYTERKPSENDKRVMVVHLTEKGKQVQQPETNYQEILDCLSLEELQQFGEYLDKIIGALEAKTNDDNEEDTMTNWVNKARERIGNEQFEQLMSMRERAFGHFGRREMPNNMPQAERFSADYDGFVPNRRRHQFFDDRNMPENRRDMSSNMRNMPPRNMPNNMTDMPPRNMPDNMADMPPRNMSNNTINSKNSK